MRVSLLSSTLIMAISFSALVHADGIVNQRRPAPQQQQPQYEEPQYDDQEYQEPQDQGYYQDEQPYDQPDVQINNNIVIQNQGYRGPVFYPQQPCISCFVKWSFNFAEVIAVGPNGFGQIVFAQYPHLNPGDNLVLINAVESLKMRGFCTNLVLRPVPFCAPGLLCNGGGPVALPPHGRPPGHFPGRPGCRPPGVRPMPRPVPFR